MIPRLIKSLFCILIVSQVNAQSAPAHLKYFGFTAIDCFYDDPLDATSTTNYVTEVDTFSNIAHMCVYDYTNNIASRVNFMNTHCLKPLLHIQNVFFEAVDTSAPSGVNYDLIANFTSRWNAFVATNSSVLSQSQIGCFYLADEPAWNGISAADMDTVCSLVKSTFPNIPLLTVEAYTTVDIAEVPTQMDWVGFDMYGIYDPETDPDFLAHLDTLKTKLSSPNQKLMLIIDDQWYPEYLTYLGWEQDTMASVIQNYYDLAVSDTSFIGLIGYIWPGGLDGPGQHGVRDLSPAVIQKNVEIGQLIKANNNPCELGILSKEVKNEVKIYPNPGNGVLSFTSDVEMEAIEIRNIHGEILMVETPNSSTKTVVTEFLSAGIYFATVRQMNGEIITQKIVIE